MVASFCSTGRGVFVEVRLPYSAPLLDYLVAGARSGSHAAWDYLASRRQAHAPLSYHGAHLLDLRPAQFPVALVNRYFAIRRNGAL